MSIPDEQKEGGGVWRGILRGVSGGGDRDNSTPQSKSQNVKNSPAIKGKEFSMNPLLTQVRLCIWRLRNVDFSNLEE